MRLKQWILLFLGVVAGCTVLFMAYNLVLDPFGVFGDRFLQWYAYDMTMNPRAAKIAWLDRHHEDYDGYIIGSSKVSSLPAEALGEYLDARFFNLTWYGGDLLDEWQAVQYLTEHYTVRHIVLAVDPQNAELYDSEADPIKQNMHCKLDGSSPLLFYGRYLLANPGYGLDKLRALGDRGYLTNADAVFLEDSGAFNKQVRDATPIGDMDSYLQLEDNVIPQPEIQLPHVEEAVARIADIRDLCREKGITLTVIGIPVNNDEFYQHDQAQMSQFWRALAEEVEFYDFWGNNSVNGDIRYYYDTNHFRNDVGRMVLARVFDDPSVWVPEDFGQLTSRETVEARIAQTYGDREPVPEERYTAQVPILMYHAFSRDPAENSDACITAENFEAHLQALTQAGYETVDYQDLRDYVLRGKALPEKPVLLSMDDGYEDNLSLAAPLLEQYGCSATVAVIGCSEGKDTYKDTGRPITPHFSLEEALPWVEKGVLTLQSHSYDMHQVPELDGADCRQGVLRMPGEEETAYVETLTEDALRSRDQLTAVIPGPQFVYTYPYGYCDILSEVVLHDLDFSVTVGTRDGVNTLVRGLSQSLYQLRRITVSGWTTPEELLARLEGESK